MGIILPKAIHQRTQNILESPYFHAAPVLVILRVCPEIFEEDIARKRCENMAQKDTSIVLVEQVQSKILFLRGEKVILDSDLAALYGVSTKRLNEQIKRNHERFPPDFMFQLTAEEVDGLRSQIATTNKGSGGRRYKPYAFTEHGVIMAASVLNSERKDKIKQRNLLVSVGCALHTAALNPFGYAQGKLC